MNQVKEDPIFTCQFCLSIFKWRYAYYKHLREQHPTPAMQISLQAKTEANLVNPTTSNTVASQPVDPDQLMTCKICAFEVKGLAAMTSHMKLHGQEPPRKFACKVCTLGFAVNNDLNFHLKNTHMVNSLK